MADQQLLDHELLLVQAVTRQGGRSENQDSFRMQEVPGKGVVVTVCDGMGGGPGGKTASTIAVNTIVDVILNSPEGEEPINTVIKAVSQANMAILEAGSEEPRLKGMGSTATVLLLMPEKAVVAHVGDSRVYQLRGGKKVFRTFDHSMVFDLVKQKVITEEQARLSAQSNIITRALGIRPELEVEAVELPYEKGDRFMLCSDGIHGTMPEKDLIRLVTEKKPIGSVADNVATTVDEAGRAQGGGHDNLTIALAETKTNSILKPIMSKQTKLLLCALAIVAALSILCNIFLAARKGGSSDEQIKALQQQVTLLKDSTVKDSVTKARLEERVGSLTKENRDLNDKLDLIQNAARH